MPSRELVIAFDADDTLWHNETIFEDVHERYREMLSHYHDAATVDRTLFATEMRNLERYGYGVKGFMLSAIETAIDLTEGKISTAEIRKLLSLGQDMLAHPVELLDGVTETVASLASSHRLLIITKGDLRDQERKVAKSGLASHFRHIEIVSDKTEAAYATILRRHAIRPADFLMVGNSLKSDIIPVLALGGVGVHIPYRITWAHEHAEAPPDAADRFFEVKSIRELPAVLAAL
ncbi:MAG: HAD family hydrolase [Opitutaceae bacterium]|jgi:putative hydrolase of the HAD superfamily